MLKRFSTLIIFGALLICLTSCTSNDKKVSAENKTTYTSYTTQDLQEAFPIGMLLDKYISKKNEMHIEHPTSIPLPNGNVGRVLQAKNGFIIICGDEKEIFGVKTFKTMDDVKNYEKSLKK
ncbi:hypothetical protein QUF99_02625 [Bacillus sp. DX4.1]|uniref:hypothetical protein n=1 Tax=Bacillus sp. DX4.1 TaxID=3055867 RepID=UPI0025A0EC4F|nr:hypothetical protein [Bacillus sp. DX4.1]MDM5186344.1 hypothetical protein [Bacillus sp. DX4.1]